MNDPEILIGADYVIEDGKRFECQLAAVAVMRQVCRERVYRMPLGDPGDEDG